MSVILRSVSRAYTHPQPPARAFVAAVSCRRSLRSLSPGKWARVQKAASKANWDHVGVIIWTEGGQSREWLQS
jgi:hypothetical protein